jgi:hypothetical protein
MRNYSKLEAILKEVDKGLLMYSNGFLYYRGKKVNGYRLGKGNYKAFSIMREGTRYRVFIHLIVFAMHYGLEELKRYETIDHINGDKYDNRIENLQGLSRFENSQKDSGGKLTVEDARTIKAKLSEGVTQAVLAEEFGVSKGTISKIKRGLRFKYV